MIHYKKGYKYQLTEEHQFNIGKVHDNLYPPDVRTSCGLLGRWGWDASPFLRLYPNGDVVQRVGYAWDGCSGPAIDDDKNQVPGLEHDGGYQLIRAGILPEVPWREIFDERLQDGIRERGMCWIRVWYYYAGVRLFGYDAATEKRKIYTAS